jgi:RNA polymerase sigma-70 factor (ECF subfamily)
MAREGVTVVALEALYRDELARFVRAAAAIAGDEGLGRDAVQEAFAQAVRARKAFRREGPLEAWVWRIVVNEALRLRRRRLDHVPEGPTAEAVDGLTERDGAVRAWVAALPERQRLAVFLRYFADLDYRSIAVALGVEVGTVSATLAAAHAALERSLKEEVHR